MSTEMIVMNEFLLGCDEKWTDRYDLKSHTSMRTRGIFAASLGYSCTLRNVELKKYEMNVGKEPRV